MIHRELQTGALNIYNNFKPIIEQKSNIDFLFAFKYARDHYMSCVKQPWCDQYVRDVKSIGYLKTVWHIRYDCNYYFRWGAPDFVREFILNFPEDVTTCGYFCGSDGYFWGRDFLSLNPEKPGQLDADRHWYHWMMWGRLGYDPNVSDERFVQILQAHFPKVNAKQLYTAWESASMIFPLTTGFHWGQVEFNWYPEGCRSHVRVAGTESGFHDVNKFITMPVHPSTGNITIPDYVKATLSGETVKGITPIQVSEELDQKADHALNIIETLMADDNLELKNTLADILCMAYLGKYYAHKIRGSAKVALYRESKDSSYQAQAIQELTEAAWFWRLYTDHAKAQYKNPLWTNRVGIVDWEKMYSDVLNDIEIAREQTN